MRGGKTRLAAEAIARAALTAIPALIGARTPAPQILQSETA